MIMRLWESSGIRWIQCSDGGDFGRQTLMVVAFLISGDKGASGGTKTYRVHEKIISDERCEPCVS